MVSHYLLYERIDGQLYCSHNVITDLRQINKLSKFMHCGRAYITTEDNSFDSVRLQLDSFYDDVILVTNEELREMINKHKGE